jgi:glyoxylase-like metal-dependent hydrolase (beta-lactamase superfamily II)
MPAGEAMPDHRYEVLALRYATSDNRIPSQNFLVVDDHDAPASPLDFYIFVIRSAERIIVVDTGFDPESGRRKGRQLLRTPAEALARHGIDAASVGDVVITHMHWDHAGGMRYFPRAQFHLQDAEMAFCTGRCMCHGYMRRAFDVEHVVDAVRAVFADRMVFHDGDVVLAPGITLHLIGGHSSGIQALSVMTARGMVVLAGDTTHLWANIRTRNPFPIAPDVGRVMEGYRTLERLADGPDHIIPGHEPLLLTRFPRGEGDPDSARLDLVPIA